MRLIDSEAYFRELHKRSEKINEDSVTKQGIKMGLRLAMNILATAPPVWEKQSAWNSGKPEREGKYIVRYGGTLIEGVFYRGALYGKKMGSRAMVRLVPDRINGWVAWPKEE